MTTKAGKRDKKTNMAWRRRRAPGTGRKVRKWTRFRSASELGSIIGNDVGGKETPGRIHLFSFLSGTNKEEVKKNNINHKDVRINQQRRHHIGRHYWSSLTTAAAAIATDIRSRWRGRSSLEAASGATTDACPESQWLEERLSGG